MKERDRKEKDHVKRMDSSPRLNWRSLSQKRENSRVLTHKGTNHSLDERFHAKCKKKTQFLSQGLIIHQ